MKPNVREARWFFFDDDELQELLHLLNSAEREGNATTEAEMMSSEIQEVSDDRKRGRRSNGYNVYIRSEEG